MEISNITKIACLITMMGLSSLESGAALRNDQCATLITPCKEVYVEPGHEVLPRLLVEEDEGRELSDYHAVMRRLEQQGAMCMPCDTLEFSSLHSLYKQRQLPSQAEFGLELNEALTMMWGEVIDNVCHELYSRTLDGRRDLLDKYIHLFSVFVSLVDECKDKEFIAPLYSGDEIENLSASLLGWLVSLNKEIKSNKAKMSNLEHLVRHLGVIMETSRVFRGCGLVPNYRYIQAGSFINSSAYRAMYEMIEQMFSEGVCLSFENTSRDSTESAANVSNGQTEIENKPYSEALKKSKSFSLKKLSIEIPKDRKDEMIRSASVYIANAMFNFALTPKEAR